MDQSCCKLLSLAGFFAAAIGGSVSAAKWQNYCSDKFDDWNKDENQEKCEGAQIYTCVCFGWAVVFLIVMCCAFGMSADGWNQTCRTLKPPNIQTPAPTSGTPNPLHKCSNPTCLTIFGEIPPNFFCLILISRFHKNQYNFPYCHSLEKKNLNVR